uniref:Uncharacterized protein n=1 Tax=Glossina morsitans morsitans TaxID=37546 RepID=A0A1B0FHB1_GLOMM
MTSFRNFILTVATTIERTHIALTVAITRVGDASGADDDDDDNGGGGSGGGSSAGDGGGGGGGGGGGDGDGDVLFCAYLNLTDCRSAFR